jgi:hypothetical protein
MQTISNMWITSSHYHYIIETLNVPENILRISICRNNFKWSGTAQWGQFLDRPNSDVAYNMLPAVDHLERSEWRTVVWIITNHTFTQRLHAKKMVYWRNYLIWMKWLLYE